MMTDISGSLARSAEAAAGWSRQSFDRALAVLKAAFVTAVLDWDEEAGEEWARLLVGGIPVAYLHTRLPLSLVLKSGAPLDELTAAGVAEVIEYEGDDQQCFSVDLEAFRQVFPRHQWRDDAASARAFSVNDLHWMTAT